MLLNPVERRSLTDAVEDQLRDGVLTGALAAGATLPGERELTAALGVNRQAVREALQRLAAAGLLEIRHGGRTRVRDYRRTAGLDLLPHLLVDVEGGVDVGVARSIMELRSCLGPEVARRCAQRAGEEERERARALGGAMAAAGDELEELAALDLELWDALVDGAGNVAYRLAYNGLRRTYEPIAALLRDTMAPELRAHALRDRLVAAVAAGRVEEAGRAAEALLALGHDAVDRLLEAVAGGSAGGSG